MSGLLRVPFFEDELLTSYLSRTAVANGSESLRSFCSDIGLGYRGILRGDGNQLVKAARLLGRSEEEFLVRRIASKGRRGAEYAGMVFDRGTMSQVPLRYCPDCLAEDEEDASRMPGTRRYARTSWVVRCVRACDRHSCLLLPLRKPARWSDGLDFLLTPCSASPVPSPPTGFERFVIDRLHGRVGHGGYLDCYTLPVCIDLCEQIGEATHLTGRQSARDAAEHSFEALLRGDLGVLDLFDRVADRMDARRAGERNKLAETIDDVSTVLGFSAEELRTLVASTFLGSLVRESRRASYRSSSYLRAEMMGLRERLIQCTNPGSEELAWLRHTIGKRKWTRAAAVNVLLEGRRATFWTRRRRSSGPNKSSGEAQVRKRLCISRRELSQLVAGGILGVSTVERTGNNSIPLEEVMSFERRYVTIRMLAAEHGLSTSQMKVKALRAGLASAFPPHLSETMIFERAAVESVFGEREGAGEQGEEEIGMPIALATDTRPDKGTRSLRKLSRLPARGERPLPLHACGLSL